VGNGNIKISRKNQQQKGGGEEDISSRRQDKLQNPKIARSYSGSPKDKRSAAAGWQEEKTRAVLSWEGAGVRELRSAPGTPFEISLVAAERKGHTLEFKKPYPLGRGGGFVISSGRPGSHRGTDGGLREGGKLGNFSTSKVRGGQGSFRTCTDSNRVPRCPWRGSTSRPAKMSDLSLAEVTWKKKKNPGRRSLGRPSTQKIQKEFGCTTQRCGRAGERKKGKLRRSA